MNLDPRAFPRAVAEVARRRRLATLARRSRSSSGRARELCPWRLASP